MFGSDWPVCLLAATHAQVVDLASQLTAHLTDEQQADVWGLTAARFYGI
jgi:L-fuconolactonase